MLDGMKPAPRVLALHAHDLEGMFRDLRTLAEAAGVSTARLERDLRRRIGFVRSRARGLPRRRVVCLEWFDPLYTTGHWVPEMIATAGGIDPLAKKGRESRRIEWSELVNEAPEKLILMPCGFTMRRARRELPLLTRRPEWPRLPAVRTGEVYLTDGPSYFNGGGVRLVDGLEILAEIIHPEAFPRRHKRGYVRLAGP